MRKTLVITGLTALVFVFALVTLRERSGPPEQPFVDTEVPYSADASEDAPRNEDVPKSSVVKDNLVVPWDIAFLPNGDILFSERGGTLTRLSPNTMEERVIEIGGVSHYGEGGLLGITLHPKFEENRFVYLYFTSSEGEKSMNTLVRYRYENDALREEVVLLENIPGSIYHNGGRIAFGPDSMLYVTTGDARTPSLAQDTSSLAGKILRIRDDGSIPSDNPFGNAVYSYGHRNPQGIAWDAAGNLWSTEHGRSGVTTGLDELNVIQKGGNYGWPESQGDTVSEGTIGPIVHSGAWVTWAPGGLTYVDGSMFFGGLRGETLYEALLSGTDVVEIREHHTGVFGRIRTTVLGPDGNLYLTTSNRDDRGEPKDGDDKIIRLNFSQFR